MASARPYLLVGPLALLYVIAFVVPFSAVILESFNAGEGAFALDKYHQFFSEPGGTTVIMRTLRIALVTTAVTLIIGYPTAAAILRLRWRALALMCILSPLLMSLLSRTFGWWTILGPGPVGKWLERLVLGSERPLLYTEVAIVIGLSSVFVPFMVLSVMSSLQAVDPEARRAAKSLGAGRWTVLRTIDVPLAMPGIIGGILLVFALSVGTYATPRILGGYENTVVAYRVVDAITGRNDPALASAISVMLVVVALTATYLNLRLGRRFKTSTGAPGVFS